MRFSIGSQCSFWRSGAMGDLWEDPSTILAAVFCILCILTISEDGSSLRRVLHESSLDVTREWINLLVFVSSRYARIFLICRKADIADEQTFFTWDFIIKCSSKMLPRFRASLDGMIGVLPTDIVTSSRAREMNLDDKWTISVLLSLRTNLWAAQVVMSLMHALSRSVVIFWLTESLWSNREVKPPWIEEGIYLRVIGVYHSVQLVCIDDVLDRRGVEGETDRANHRPLWNSAFILENSREGLEPRKCRCFWASRASAGALKTFVFSYYKDAISFNVFCWYNETYIITLCYNNTLMSCDYSVSIVKGRSHHWQFIKEKLAESYKGKVGDSTSKLEISRPVYASERSERAWESSQSFTLIMLFLSTFLSVQREIIYHYVLV